MNMLIFTSVVNFTLISMVRCLTCRLAVHGNDTGGLPLHLPRVEGPHTHSHLHGPRHGEDDRPPTHTDPGKSGLVTLIWYTQWCLWHLQPSQVAHGSLLAQTPFQEGYPASEDGLR